VSVLILQTEADLLKQTAIGGVRTKVIALGIGVRRTNQPELNYIASAPQSRNVILVSDFSALTNVEDQLRSASCTGQ